MDIKSPKLARFVAQAKALGLEVTVEVNDSEYGDSYNAIISRPQVEGETLLAQMYNHEFLSIHAHRYTADGKPRAFKIRATSYPVFTKARNHQVRTIPFLLNMWAEDVADYNNNRQENHEPIVLV